MKTKKEIEERLNDLDNAITLADKRIINFPPVKRVRAIREIEVLLWILDKEPTYQKIKGEKEE